MRINARKMKLIIPDIHNQTARAELIISSHQEAEEIIFLGDYFDSFDDTPADASRTARWLRKSLDDPRRRHLFGNHDLPYAFPWHSSLGCPGYTAQKAKVVRNLLDAEHWDQVLPFYLIAGGERPLLFTHAGLTLPNLYGFKAPELSWPGGRFDHLSALPSGEHLATLKGEAQKWSAACRTGDYHHFMYGGSRHGKPGQGGPQWIDARDFTPIPGIDQTVGHTIRKEPTEIVAAESRNLFLDCRLEFYAIWDGGRITAMKSPQLF